MTEQEKVLPDQERFDTLLPWYVNGTLVNNDRIWMEDFVRLHPEAASELRLQQRIQTALHENAAAVPADIGLHKLMQRVRQDKQAAPVPMRSIKERLAEFFGGFQLTPAMGTAFAVIMIQAGLIGTLLVGNEAQEPEYARTRAIVAPELEGPFLKINFYPDARESDMRFALVSVGATLVSGPSQLGDYFIKVPAPEIDAASNQLKASGLVESISVVPSLPNKG